MAEPLTESRGTRSGLKGLHTALMGLPFDLKQSRFPKAGQRPSPGKSLARRGKEWRPSHCRSSFWAGEEWKEKKEGPWQRAQERI